MPPIETVPDAPRSRPPVRGGADLQPRRPESGARSLWGRLVRWSLLLALLWAGWHYYPVWEPWLRAQLPNQGSPPAKRTPPPASVMVATAIERDVNVYLNALGTVTALNTVLLKSRVDGELVNVAFTEGQMVKQGDLLVEIDRRPFEVLRDQAQARLAQDEAALVLAQGMYNRQLDLMKSQATTPQQLDQQLAVTRQAEAAVQLDKAALQNALLQLEYCRITAPLSGRVGLRLVDKGNIVRANDPNGLAVITQLEPIALTFTVPQDEIPRVQQRMRQKLEMPVEAFNRDFTTRLSIGQLAAIDNQVDATTGTLRMKAVFENLDHALFPNQFVNARLLIDTLEKAIVVPSAAVQRGPENMYVYVLQPDSTVQLRPVTIGPVQGAETCLLTGVEAGETVVTSGIDKLQPGSKVTLREPDGQKAGSLQTPSKQQEQQAPAETKSST
ncbi:efflux RND transporter periplasmic adaptor subunit [Planctomicrobium sp. SH664]|uniref:efflux RND transporter periplasmic adaptor subunit n=1 Tax=Planctomicrobium sp. SH664 TaxID=3448125 RepID=UPI003F5C946E